MLTFWHEDGGGLAARPGAALHRRVWIERIERRQLRRRNRRRRNRRDLRDRRRCGRREERCSASRRRLLSGGRRVRLRRWVQSRLSPGARAAALRLSSALRPVWRVLAGMLPTRRGRRRRLRRKLQLPLRNARVRRRRMGVPRKLRRRGLIERALRGRGTTVLAAVSVHGLGGREIVSRRICSD